MEMNEYSRLVSSARSALRRNDRTRLSQLIAAKWFPLFCMALDAVACFVSLNGRVAGLDALGVVVIAVGTLIVLDTGLPALTEALRKSDQNRLVISRRFLTCFLAVFSSLMISVLLLFFNVTSSPADLDSEDEERPQTNAVEVETDEEGASVLNKFCLSVLLSVIPVGTTMVIAFKELVRDHDAEEYREIDKNNALLRERLGEVSSALEAFRDVVPETGAEESALFDRLQEERNSFIRRTGEELRQLVYVMYENKCNDPESILYIQRAGEASARAADAAESADAAPPSEEEPEELPVRKSA